MDVQVNWWAVVLATVVAMVIGMVWYAKPVFGSTWQKLVGKSDKDLKEMSWMPVFLAIAANFISAWVLAHLVFLSNYFYAADYSWMGSALMTAFFVWLGFQVTLLLIHESFEQRPSKLIAMTAANQLAVLLGMGLVIGLLEP
jgi:hypothetical protein